MSERPLSITIISLVLIVQAILGFVGALLFIDTPEVREIMREGPLSPEIQVALSYIGPVILGICGIGLLKALNWARLVYVAWAGFNLILGFATIPERAPQVASVVIFLIVTFFLFRPAANAYFRGAPLNSDAD